MKVEIEAHICTRTNYGKCNINLMEKSPMCSLCGKRVETETPTVSHCMMLALKNTNKDMITWPYYNMATLPTGNFVQNATRTKVKTGTKIGQKL